VGEFDRQPEHSYQDTLEAQVRRRRALADLGTANRRMELRLMQLNREMDRLLQQRQHATGDADTALCEHIDHALTGIWQQIKGLEADQAAGAQAMAQAAREIVRTQAGIDVEGWG
jgi:ElaB/YqjD/DUF883 family membrane-anchored ribosome-binding protein